MHRNNPRLTDAHLVFFFPQSMHFYITLKQYIIALHMLQLLDDFITFYICDLIFKGIVYILVLHCKHVK